MSTLTTLLLLASCTRPEGRTGGDCTDGADNDGDALFDCADDGCVGSPDCALEGDADADSDADSDTDADADADADSDSDTGTPVPSERLDGALMLDEEGFLVGGETEGEASGRTFAADGDANGDGQADLLIGAMCADPGLLDAGRASLALGPITTAYTLGDADASFVGTEAGDYTGALLDYAGDMDGDGYTDLVISSPDEYASGTDVGKVWLVLSPNEGSHSLDDADARWEASYDDYHGVSSGLGNDLAGVGDVTGDGLGDVALGAGQDPTSGYGAGAVYVLSWPVDTTGDLSASQAQIYGGDAYSSERSGDALGNAVAGPGDMDGDGVADLAVQASCASGRGGLGCTEVFYGPLEGSQYDDAPALSVEQSDTSTAGPLILAAAGDVDGDGLRDLLIGDSGGYAHTTSTVWLVAGGTTGTIGAAMGAATLQSDDTTFATAMQGVGDLDGDGAGDVALGGEGVSAYGNESGVAWLYYGPLSGSMGPDDASAILYGAGDRWYAGWSVGAADLSGDGRTDLLLGVPGLNSGAGGVWVVPGV